MLLDAIKCNDASLAGILSIVKNIMLLIQIIVPVILIISGIISFTQLMMNPDEKNGLKKLMNKFLAAATVFIIPMIINVVMGICGENYNFSSCWVNAGDYGFNNSEYNSSNDGTKKDKTKINGDYKNYEKSTNSKVSKYIFIGDSRTVGMYMAKSGKGGGNYSNGGARTVGDDVYIAQGSKGLDWMNSTGKSALDGVISKGSAIIILMGINDMRNVDGYITSINAMSKEYKDSKVYFVSVNPCTSQSKNCNNNYIKSFNKTIKSNIIPEVTFLDTNSFLTSDGFNTTDGIHYDKKTYLKLYDYIKKNI